MKPSDVSEETIEKYYRDKLEVVERLERAWVEMSVAEPSKLQATGARTASLMRRLDDIDGEYANAYGRELFEAALAERRNPAEPACVRARLKLAMEAAIAAAVKAGRRASELKDGIGQRLSSMRSGRKLSRHGRLDFTG